MIIKKGEGEGFVAEREDDLSHGSRSHKGLKEKSGGRRQPTTINKKNLGVGIGGLAEETIGNWHCLTFAHPSSLLF